MEVLLSHALYQRMIEVMTRGSLLDGGRVPAAVSQRLNPPQVRSVWCCFTMATAIRTRVLARTQAWRPALSVSSAFVRPWDLDIWLVRFYSQLLENYGRSNTIRRLRSSDCGRRSWSLQEVRSNGPLDDSLKDGCRC